MPGLGDTPYQHRGYQNDPRRLFYSDPNIALTKKIMIPAGHGILKAGTVMGAITESTNRKGWYVPYAVQAPAAALAFISGAYLLLDGALSAECHVSMDDSYKFEVGDHLGAVDSDATPIDLGAIVSIDRTTYSHKAVVTATNNVTTAITVAAGGMIFIQTEAASPHSKAKAILAGTYDTGVGENAKGASEAVVVISNAILYKAACHNIDADAITDLGVVEDGQHFILK
jgi:hypothetical protein